MNMVVGIDASRIRSGGGVAHLVGILGEGDPALRGIRQVHLWSHKALLDAVPDAPWLRKHHPPQLERSLASQVWWQLRTLPQAARRTGCDVLFTADASTVCGFRPSVVLSQDMQSYEPGLMRHYRLSPKRLRLILIGHLQSRSIKRADGVIFLTDYAAQTIQNTTGNLPHVRVIPHGVGADFRQTRAARERLESAGGEIRCVYVSNAAMYKHQWVVVRAFAELRRRRLNVRLLLVGGGAGRARRLMDEAIAETDPAGGFIQCRESVPHAEIPSILARADLFVFASSCENMPVTLLEAMAMGLPIASSNRGPMPEVLGDAGVYFDPEDAGSIADAVERIVTDRTLRATIAERAKNSSEQYSWSRCADETWAFIADTYKRTKKS